MDTHRLFLYRKHYALFAIISLVAATIFLMDVGGIFDPLDLKAYDALFYFRAKITDPQTETPIVIVEIDDRTFQDEAFRIPFTLWHSFFKKVIEGIADCGVSVIGLDYLLPRKFFDDIVPNYSRVWLRTLVYARSKGVPLVTGYLETADRQILPEARYVQIIGPDNIGLFNLTTDQDDFVRRQKLVYPTIEGGKKLYSFSYLVARAFQPDLSPPSDIIYIDYLHPDYSYPRYSFAEVYRRVSKGDISLLRTQLKGKIVLIGSTDASSKDYHPTPLYYLYEKSKRRTPGVEVVAHIVNTLLAKNFFTETSVYARLSIYFSLALIASIFNFFTRLGYSLFFLPIFILAYGAMAVTFFLYYIILPVVPGIASIALSQSASFSYRHFVIDKEKRRTRAVFERFLPRKLVTQLLETKDSDFFRGEQRRLCVLFSDIRSFTKYSEDKSPVEVVSRLNEYFEAMSSVIFSEDGVVDKFLGDGLMAFFGALDNGQNPSVAGARSALKMLDELEQLNRRWQQQGMETFKIGIGIHTGEVKVGNIGSYKKMEYTVIGDTVNLASRLQDKTKILNETILISDEVYKDLGGGFRTQDKGVEEIRGRSPIRIYALKAWGNER